ncbi:MAG: ParB/RepB/Spo0J family partition protein [Ruminococcaceae bacterium]|nr:ParB/RepB/Spo0J family partition protein [Oscillospiraceae bacterium]
MAEKAKRGLGTGLGALFSEPEPAEDAAPPTVLPISRVEPRAEQPRKEFEPEALEALADSIREYGLIQPITVRALDKGYYQIIAGERRWRAARMAGLREVPVRILEADDRLTAEMALVENLQREDLNPLEEARGYRQLMADYELTQEEVAKRVQKSRSAVANSLRLLGLSAPVLDMVEKGILSAGHARALLPLADEALQLSAAKKVVDEQLSVRQTEALAARLQKGEPNREPPHKSMYTKAAEEQLTSALGRAVRFTGGVNKGRITLEFYSADDREALMTALMDLKKK